MPGLDGRPWGCPAGVSLCGDEEGDAELDAGVVASPLTVLEAPALFTCNWFILG